jgi:glycosyltransferase involved in cell wall biosynthesis
MVDTQDQIKPSEALPVGDLKRPENTDESRFPEVTVLICTYNRPDEIQVTVEALRSDLLYPRDKLHWLVADDSSPKGYLTKLKKSPAFDGLNAQFVVTDKNSGWGANVNNGLHAVQTPYVFFLEDDYVLSKSLDLRVGIALLETKPDIGMLRYRGTAGAHTIFHQFEANVAAWLPDYQDGVGLPGKLTYLQLDSGSPTLNLYSHGPHLKRNPGFHAFYGLYPEGLKLGETVEAYAHTVKDGMKQPGAPALVILPKWVAMAFDHIGKSWKDSEWDK